MSESLNVRVARALGWPELKDGEDIPEGLDGYISDGVAMRIVKDVRRPITFEFESTAFRPATEWCDTMLAAQRVDLMNSEAICLAILKLKEGETT